jgi:uncharacterized glyoxalase superfamily protein PhnB
MHLSLEFHLELMTRFWDTRIQGVTERFGRTWALVPPGAHDQIFGYTYTGCN